MNRLPATVYWRPGCAFCSRLIGDLDRVGVPYHAVNIWDDPTVAAVVRSIADGNETVSTVVVGDHSLVNPAQPRCSTRTGTSWAGLAPTLAVAVIWLALATANPTTTYHLAPALVAAERGAQRVDAHADQVLTARPRALGSAVIALATTALLARRDALAGPALFGLPTALTETLISIAAGTVLGTGLALARRRMATP